MSLGGRQRSFVDRKSYNAFNTTKAFFLLWLLVTFLSAFTLQRLASVKGSRLIFLTLSITPF